MARTQSVETGSSTTRMPAAVILGGGAKKKKTQKKKKKAVGLGGQPRAEKPLPANSMDGSSLARLRRSTKAADEDSKMLALENEEGVQQALGAANGSQLSTTSIDALLEGHFGAFGYASPGVLSTLEGRTPFTSNEGAGAVSFYHTLKATEEAAKADSTNSTVFALVLHQQQQHSAVQLALMAKIVQLDTTVCRLAELLGQATESGPGSSSSCRQSSDTTAVGVTPGPLLVRCVKAFFQYTMAKEGPLIHIERCEIAEAVYRRLDGNQQTQLRLLIDGERSVFPERGAGNAVACSLSEWLRGYYESSLKLASSSLVVACDHIFGSTDDIEVLLQDEACKRVRDILCLRVRLPVIVVVGSSSGRSVDDLKAAEEEERESTTEAARTAAEEKLMCSLILGCAVYIFKRDLSQSDTEKVKVADIVSRKLDMQTAVLEDLLAFADSNNIGPRLMAHFWYASTCRFGVFGVGDRGLKPRSDVSHRGAMATFHLTAVKLRANRCEDFDGDGALEAAAEEELAKVSEARASRNVAPLTLNLYGSCDAAEYDDDEEEEDEEDDDGDEEEEH